MRRGLPIGIVVVALAALAAVACSGEKGVRCDDSALYDSSNSSPPVRVPDDLTVPDESQALLIPGPPGGSPEAAPTDGCLESPPPYSQTANPG
jgi:uncharacterized lipoprotein